MSYLVRSLEPLLAAAPRRPGTLFLGLVSVAVLPFAFAGETVMDPSAPAEEPPPSVQEGFSIMEQGDFDGALSIFDAVLQNDGGNIEALLGRALVFSEQQRHEQAFDSYDAIVRRFPDHAFAWNGRGLAAFNLENFDVALDSFEKATADEPINGFFYESIAWTHMCRGDFTDAAKAAKTASLMYNREGQVSLYPLLIAYFSYLELGDRANAERAIQYAQGNVRSPAWPLPVLQYVAGRITADELIGHVTTTAEETEAHTYIGLVLRLRGEGGPADRHLDWVRHRGDPRVFEYTLARTLDKGDQGPGIAGLVR